MNPYKTLGVKKTATQDQIRKAYHKKAAKWHPDKNPGNSEEAQEKFREVQEAYEILGDPTTRSHYDKTGECRRHPTDTKMFDVMGNVFQLAMGRVVKMSYQSNGMISASNVDFIDMMKEELKNKHKTIQQAVMMFERIIKELKEVQKRITDPEGLVARAIELELAATEGMLEETKGELEWVTPGLKYLDTLGYDSKDKKIDVQVRMLFGAMR